MAVHFVNWTMIDGTLQERVFLRRDCSLLSVSVVLILNIIRFNNTYTIHNKSELTLVVPFGLNDSTVCPIKVSECRYKGTKI